MWFYFSIALLSVLRYLALLNLELLWTMQVASTLTAVPFGHQLSFGGSDISSTTQGLPSGSWFLQGYARLYAWLISLLET